MEVEIISHMCTRTPVVYFDWVSRKHSSVADVPHRESGFQYSLCETSHQFDVELAH